MLFSFWARPLDIMLAKKINNTKPTTLLICLLEMNSISWQVQIYVIGQKEMEWKLSRRILQGIPVAKRKMSDFGGLLLCCFLRASIVRLRNSHASALHKSGLWNNS